MTHILNRPAQLMIAEKAPVIAVAGLPGAGKSQFADELARLRPDAVVLDPDFIGKEIVDAAMSKETGNRNDRDGDFYRDEIFPDHLAILAASARILHKAKFPVVLSTPMIAYANAAVYQGSTLATVASRALGLQIDLTVWMDVTEAGQRTRLEKRGFARDVPKLRDWDAYRHSLGTAADLPDGIADVRLNGSAAD